MPTVAPTILPLYLMLREHYGNGGRYIVRARETRHLLLNSLFLYIEIGKKTGSDTWAGR